MEMFYSEATKACEEVDECQSPEGLGPTENSFDLTSLIFEDTFDNQVFTLPSSQNNNEDHLIDELNLHQNNNVQMTTTHYSPQMISTTINPNILSPTQLKLEESVNLTSISQTSLISDEAPFGFSVKEEPNSKSNSRRRKMSEPDLDDIPDYRNKRDRNNIAVRKSREKAREQQKMAKDRVDSLRQENKILENKVAQLQSELKLCRSMFMNARIPVPQVLEDVLKKT